MKNLQSKPLMTAVFALAVVCVVLLSCCGRADEDPFVAVGGEDLSQTVICPRQVTVNELDRDVDGLIVLDTQYSFLLPEPLGYRGDDYWRFYIHFDTVYKTGDYCYAVEGRTRFRDTVRRFEGEVILDSLSIVWTLDSLDDIAYRFMRAEKLDAGGWLYGHYLFREDSTVQGSGVLQGKVTYSVMRQNGILRYDTENIDCADGYDNNQYEGTWTSVDGSRSEKCNWGDFRIPDSWALDIGCAEFSPDEEYVNNGWQLIRDFLNVQYGTPEMERVWAAYRADEEWWRR